MGYSLTTICVWRVSTIQQTKVDLVNNFQPKMAKGEKKKIRVITTLGRRTGNQGGVQTDRNKCIFDAFFAFFSRAEKISRWISELVTICLSPRNLLLQRKTNWTRLFWNINRDFNVLSWQHETAEKTKKVFLNDSDFIFFITAQCKNHQKESRKLWTSKFWGKIVLNQKGHIFVRKSDKMNVTN